MFQCPKDFAEKKAQALRPGHRLVSTHTLNNGMAFFGYAAADLPRVTENVDLMIVTRETSRFSVHTANAPEQRGPHILDTAPVETGYIGAAAQ